jgi:hypothetical protein
MLKPFLLVLGMFGAHVLGILAVCRWKSRKREPWPCSEDSRGVEWTRDGV